MKKISFIFLLGLMSNVFYAQSPQLVKDIFAGSGDGVQSINGFAYNNKLLFTAYTPAEGFDLWISDGTSAGTHLLKDICPGNCSIQNFNYGYFNYNGKVYFDVDDGTHGIELWVTDGTTAGTKLLLDIYPGINGARSNSHSFIVLNNVLYFVADDGTHGYELWRTDGTTAGTWMVKDIFIGSNGGIGNELVLFNNLLFFPGTNGTNGTELWKSDGTSSGTSMVADIDPSGSGITVFFPLVNNGILYFIGTTSSEGRELWRSDGTQQGTQLVKDICPGSQSAFNPAFPMKSLANKIYFLVNDGSISGMELFCSDGTASGTAMVKEINPGGFADCCDASFHLENNNFGKLFFRATDGSLGYELFTTDGTLGGTTIVRDIYFGSSDGLPYTNVLLPAAGYMFFTANDATNGIELWRTDGTTSGTTLVKDIRPGTSNAGITNLTQINSLLYFWANDGTNGNEVWRSDGTLTGTTMLGDINPGSLSSDPADFVPAGNYIFFSATNNLTGRELYVLPNVVGLEELEANIESLTVYPNPSKDIFRINCANDTKVHVHNLLGEEILNTNLEKKETQIDLSSQPPGIYLLRVGSTVKKIIKE